MLGNKTGIHIVAFLAMLGNKTGRYIVIVYYRSRIKMKKSIVVILLIMITTSFCYGENVNFKEADLNRDGYIYIDDMELLQKDLMTLAAPYRGDINNDNYVNSKDLFILINIIINKLPRELINKLNREKIKLFTNYLLSFTKKEFSQEDIEKFKKVTDYIENNREEFKIVENEVERKLIEEETKEIKLIKEIKVNKE
jgi:hypothetical protein